MMMLDLTTLALYWIGGSILILPLLIATVRLAIIPLIQALGRPARDAVAESRLARLEESVGHLSRELEQMAAGQARRTA